LYRSENKGLAKKATQKWLTMKDFQIDGARGAIYKCMKINGGEEWSLGGGQ
jgi:hypothetical protein